jgi:Xaa-Pro aminopeptidase
MRLASELATAAMEQVRDSIRPGMKTSEVGAMYEGHVHSTGIGYKGKVDMARAFTLVWSGPSIRTFTATGDAPVSENEPTLLEIWVCADGYWIDLTKNACPGELIEEYDTLTDGLLEIYDRAVDHVRPGASLAELDRLVRDGIAELGYPGQPSHPIAHGVGARAHEPPYAHQAAPGELSEGMVIAVEPGAYWAGGGGLRVEDDFLVTADGCERLGTYPDDFRGQ